MYNDTAHAALAGMRRVDRVRIVEGSRLQFFVDGVGHRLPVSREVTPSVARVLMQEYPYCVELTRKSAV